MLRRVRAMPRTAPAAEHRTPVLLTLLLAMATFMQVLDRILAGQANMLATNDVFWLSGCLLIALIPLIWLARPPFGRPSAAVRE